MHTFTLTCAGTGDAFATAGRFQTCFHLKTPAHQLLIDCGASSLHALHQQQVDLNAVDAILITHYHGDHFAGIPFFLLACQYKIGRTAPLVIAGPGDPESRVHHLLRAIYPKEERHQFSFPITFVSLPSDQTVPILDCEVTAIPVTHSAGADAHGLRIRCGEKTIAYSGDSQWMNRLPDLARNTALFICECYSHRDAIPNHMNWVELQERRTELATERLVFTHMGDTMFGEGAPLHPDLLFDGAVLKI